MAITKKQGIIAAIIVSIILIFVLVYFQPQTLFINTTATESQQGEIVMRSTPDTEDVEVIDEEMEEVAKSTWRSQDKETTGEVFLTQEDDTLFVRLENLDTSNGPDLFVYIARDVEGDGTPIDFVNLGSLKANKGDSNYEVPADVDINEYNYVVIWCERFSVSFADAAI